MSQYPQNEYKLKSYKFTFSGSSVTLIYNFEPSSGWTIDQEAIKPVRGIWSSILVIVVIIIELPHRLQRKTLTTGCY